MMRSPRGVLRSVSVASALACALGLSACWVIVGGEEKILVDEASGRGGRTGKSPTQAGSGGAAAGGLGSGEGGSGDAGSLGVAGGTAGQTNAGGAGNGGSAGSGANAMGGASANGGASGLGGVGAGQGGASSGAGGGSSGASGSGPAGGSNGSGGAGAGGLGGASGSAGKGGTAGAAGSAGGAAGATGGVQTGPGQFDCKAEPAKSSYAFCTNFSPAPSGWEEFTGCNTRPMASGNTTLLWSGAAGSKCGAFLDATKPLTPKQASLSLWVRAKEIGVAQSEPSLGFTTLTVGVDLSATIGIRQTRNGLGTITGNILVVTSSALPDGTLDIGAFPLDVWHHVTVTLGFKDGKLVVGGAYGITSADELATKSVDTPKAGVANGSVVTRLSFIQTEFLAGPTSVEVDDLYLH